MERSILAFTTLTFFAPLAQASHPKQAIRPEGTASQLEFVATSPNPQGLRYARQVLPAQPNAALEAQSRVIYLNPNGVILRPGDNDSATQTSSIVTSPTEIGAWATDDQTWSDTVDCVKQIYAPFDVTITDSDPGNVPHIEAIFGGSPGDVGLPDNVAGVSPFTTDCSIIENSIVFGFTDVMPDDSRTVCEVMSQEIAHSFGLDHEMLPSDPMTYLDYTGDRTFKDQMVPCGEFTDRKCGINGNMCRQQQNSVALLRQRIGVAGGGSGSNDPSGTTDGSGMTGGCSAGGGAGSATALALLGIRRRRRR